MARPVTSTLRSAHEPNSRRSGRAATASMLVVGAGVCAYALVFGRLSWRSYWAFQMHAQDMGNMGQAAWNTVHGHPFSFTNVRQPWHLEAWNTTTRLSFHVEALFPFISLTYLIFPHPESLIYLQVIAVALGAIPVFLLARSVLQSALLGVAFAFAYLLFPTVQSMTLYEFHPVSLATPLLLLAFLFAYRNNMPGFVVCCLVAMGTKEEIGLVVAVLALYIGLMRGRWQIVLPLALFGVAWSLFATIVVEHHFRHPGTYTYAQKRYGYLGHGIRGVLHTVLHRPGAIVSHVFTLSKAAYLWRLIVPDGLLAVLSPWTLLITAPTVALNLLSIEPKMYSGLGQDSAEVVSVVTIAAIFGARYVLNALAYIFSSFRARLIVATYVTFTAAISSFVYGYAPLDQHFALPEIGYHQQLEARFASRIPAAAVVSASDQIDPHLSSRRYLYLFPDIGVAPPLMPATFALIDVSAPPYPVPTYQMYDRTHELLTRKGWSIVDARDGLLLLRRGPGRHTPSAAFYTFLNPQSLEGATKLSGAAQGLAPVAYAVQRTDRVNNRNPGVQFKVWLRVQRRIRENVEPVVFEVSNGSMVDCSSDPLGLAWFPPSRWKPRRTYTVAMSPIPVSEESRAPVHFVLTLARAHAHSGRSCQFFWSLRGKTWKLGNVAVSL